MATTRRRTANAKAETTKVRDEFSDPPEASQAPEVSHVQHHLNTARDLLDEAKSASSAGEQHLFLMTANVNATIALAEAIREWYSSSQE